MAEDAEKKNIARLDFKIDDAISSLTEIDKKLEKIAQSSEAYAKKIGQNINGAIKINANNIIDTGDVQKKFQTITGHTNEFGKKMKYTLSGTVDFSKMIDVKKFKEDFNKLESIGVAGAKKITITQLNENAKVTANRKKQLDNIDAAEKVANARILTSESKTADQIKVIKENVTAYKEKRAADAALAQEKANLRVLNSTKTLYDKITEYAKTYIIYQGFNKLKEAAIDTVEEMKKVEYRMMEISRIMEEGSIIVDKYRDSLIGLAYEYGRSFDDVSTITLNFARAGYDAQDAIAMTEQSLLALNTAELDAEQSTEGLISILAQWDMNTGTTAEKSQNLANVIDKINKTADKFPISSEGLLEALKRTSQGFNLAGATIDETIAMIVAAETASQRGGKTIGTAMANMQQQLKAEGKLDLAKSLGLDLFEDEAETRFKSITEIFSLMSERMKNLEEAGKGSSTEMQKLLELFTVFRRNIGAGLLSEMSGEDSTYMSALKNSLDSAGYSAQENSKYMGTMEAATQKLNATILQLQSTLYDEGGKSIFTTFILGAEGGINIINSLIQKFGLLPTTVATATLAFSIFNKNLNYEGLKKYTLKLSEAKAALNLYNETVRKGELTSKEFNEIMGKDTSKNMQKYIEGLDGAEASMGKYIAKTIAAKAGQLALNVAIAAGQAAISFGLSLAIQAIVNAISDWVNATKKASESIQTMNDNLDSTVSELQTYSSEFETLRKEMESGNLTQEEYNVKKKDLIVLQEELIDKFDDEAKGINLVTGEIKEQKEAIESLAKANYQKYIQENQKEIDKLTKKVEKNIKQKTQLSIGGQIVGKDFASDMQTMTGTQIAGESIKQLGLVEISGNPEQVLKQYREMFNKLQEYSNQNYDKLTAHEQSYLNSSINAISETISKLDKKYSEDLKIYQEYLNNKLQYDNYYSSVYGQILASRARLSEAMVSGDNTQIEEAQKNLNEVYKTAIEKAQKDPDVANGMVNLLQEQIKNLNDSTDREQIKIKIGVDSDELHKSIQDIISNMGKISLEDLEEGLQAETLTESMSKLKEILDQNSLSVEDLIENFDYLGFSIGEIPSQVEGAADTIEYLTKQTQNSIDSLAALDSGFVSVYSAMNEFNENGYITGATLQSLINNDLLQFFDVVNGKLSINEAAMANAATAAKAKAIEDLQAKAAAEIAAIAFDTESSAAGTAESTTSAMTQKTREVKGALAQMTPEALKAADAWVKLNAAMGGSMEGLGQDQVNQIQNIMNNLSKSITAINSVKIESVSYRRTTAKSSGGSNAAAQKNAEREAKEAAEAAKKAEEEAYKTRLKKFTDYIDEKERLEKRWVDKQKELGMLSNDDYMYVTQQRIERYKKYLQEVKNATWINAEDRLELEKKYSEKIEDLQVDYLGYLQDQLDEEIEALEKANQEKIDLIEKEADARIEALDKVSEATDRARKKEDYESERQSILDEISYWEQRTGREAQEALVEARKKLAELDAEWEDTQEDWSIEDQIAEIEAKRDAEIAAIESAEKKEIESLKAIYDAKVKMYVETGNLIYDESVIQSQSLYNAYKTNFIDPISSELSKLNVAPTVATTTQTQAEEKKQQYETYTIQRGDTLSKIAKRYGTTVEKIMAANPYITNKNKIYAGKTLQIPKFHEGGIFGGNYEEGLALLKRGEVILKPSWSASLDRMMRYFDNLSFDSQSSVNNGPVINVEGDLIRIEANVRNQSDINAIERKLEKMLKDKFNIKK